MFSASKLVRLCAFFRFYQMIMATGNTTGTTSRRLIRSLLRRLKTKTRTRIYNVLEVYVCSHWEPLSIKF